MPAATLDTSPWPPPNTPTSRPARGETILIVEDEDSVRSLTARTLRRIGYDVLEANNGAEALRLSERRQGPFTCC
jgi:response regulator RpfG family c-di-GMP phosphodiesterase